MQHINIIIQNNLMKKILGIVVLGLLWCGTSYSLDMDTCSDYAAKAKTTYASEIMFGLCIHEKDTYFYNRSKMFKCAKGILNANTKHAAEIKMYTCLKKN